jgi:signal peptidase
MIGSLTAVALLAAFWLVFAPVQIGGSTSYAVTEGISMLPKLHGGDLAVVRAGSSYSVGDAVLYDSPVLHRPVLHRIIAVRDGQYSLQGDNNDFVDPGSIAASAIVGRLWFSVPRIGRWVGWLSAPLHAAAIAVAAALILLLGGTARRSRRARRRGRAERPAQQPAPPRVPASPQSPAASRSAGPGLHTVTPRDFMFRGVNLHRAFVPLAGTMVLALLVTAVGLAVPGHRTEAAPGAYRQAGDFSYESKLVAPNAAYPTGLAQTGDPLLLDLFHDATVRFSFRFDSRLPHQIKGTIALNTLVSAATSYRRTFPLQQAVAFEGDTAITSGVIDLAAWRAFFDQLSADSGAVGADYDVDLQAVVTIVGVVDGRPIHETFTPVLPFNFNHQLVKLDVPASATATGADVTAPGVGLASIVSPEKIGSLPQRVPNAVSIAHFRLDVMKLRILGLLLGGFALASMIVLAVTRPPIRARREQDLIAKRYARLLVPVLSVNPEDRPTIELPDFHSLARFAQNYEHLVMAEHHGRVSTYAVDEAGRLYVYRIDRAGPNGRGRAPAATVAVPPPQLPETTLAPHAPSPEGMPVAVSWRKLARPAGALCLLVAGLSVVSGFTASNTVPVTYAGKKTQAVTDNQLAPSRCSVLQLTDTIVMSPSATSVTGTGSNELILGANRKGTVNYNGRGGNDCIVAGGGAGSTNVIDGGTGSNDICIGAPGAANSFKNCDQVFDG